MCKYLLLLLALPCVAANITNLPAIADKPWVTNQLRSSSALATNSPSAGYVLTTSGTSNYWAAASGGSSNTLYNSYLAFDSTSGPTNTGSITNIIVQAANNIFYNTNTHIIYVTNAGVYSIYHDAYYTGISPSASYVAIRVNGVYIANHTLPQVSSTVVSSSMKRVVMLTNNSTIQFNLTRYSGSSPAYLNVAIEKISD